MSDGERLAQQCLPAPCVTVMVRDEVAKALVEGDVTDVAVTVRGEAAGWSRPFDSRASTGVATPVTGVIVRGEAVVALV